MDEYLNQLWLNFHQALLNFIRQKISNPEDAEDILQNVFIKIQTSIHKLKEREKVVPWLYRITRNTIIDQYRLTARNKTSVFSINENAMDASTQEDEESWKSEIANFLVDMAGNLPGKYGGAFKMYELEGLNHRQIADRLGISVSGSKTRVQRSREKLKEILICVCRSKVEPGNAEDIATQPVCSHMVKLGENNLCIKRMQED